MAGLQTWSSAPPEPRSEFIPLNDRRAFSLPPQLGRELREDIEFSVLKAHSLYSLNPTVYDKVAASAVLVYSTFCILATFLCGTQAGLAALFITDRDARTRHKLLMYFCIGISLAALLLHLAVAILSTLLVLFLTLDKIVVAISGLEQRGNSRPKTQQPFLFLSAQLEEMEYFRKMLVEDSYPTSVSASFKIISRMKGTFWDMGVVLIVSTLFTFISVYLYAWTNLAMGIVATVVATFNTLLLYRTTRSLQVSKKMEEWKARGLLGEKNITV